MSRVQKLRLFVSQRLNAAVEDILAAFEKTVVKYEQEAALCQEVISRQHALLCALHNPLMEPVSTDSFSQQLVVPSQHHDQEDPEPSRIREEPEREPLLDLDEADIIQFTYSTKPGPRLGQDVDRLSALGEEPDPDPEIQLVSSETEDSDDYSRDSDTRTALSRSKAKQGRRPGGPLSCRVCNRTFRARRALFRHLRAHLQEAVCGVCGGRFEAAESLKIHIQTHRTPQRKRGEPEVQTRTRSGERRSHRPNTKTSPEPHTCGECGKRFLQVWRKRKHRCHPPRLGQEGPQGTVHRTRT
ncbi:zinc finger protein 48-like [Dicentrarchus labrax]|uniref:zinc finger protein 48-like n=1 Tax=Dicentrarchus labrax TaxID=13489 RepID=UPI0021F5DFE2|nr:zinc finger protein 48-like [Dicentrarchus labrax]